MPDVPFVRRKVTVSGRVIAYREEAEPRDQPPLVLIHGLGMSSKSFRTLLPHLADGFHVFAPDLPGAGASDKPEEPLSVDALVTAVLGWMDAVHLREAAFVGHSLGGQIVTYLCQRNPERVSRAVLVAATPDPTVAPAWRKALWLLADGLIEPPAFVALATRDYLRANPHRMWGTLKQALRSDVDARARAVQVPTLVVRGSWDLVVREPWSRQLAETIPNGRYLSVPRGSHGLPAQAPAKLAAIIRDFLGAPMLAESDAQPPNDAST